MSERTGQIVDAARVLIDEGGSTALTMRALGIRAPSLYKHFPDKGAVEAQVITLAMRELASALERTDSLFTLAETYRAYALAHPHLYRLMNSGPLPRHLLPPGVEDAAALPLVRAVGGDLNRARAVWAFAHGMVILELDGRFPPDAEGRDRPEHPAEHHGDGPGRPSASFVSGQDRLWPFGCETGRGM